jgi:hypothetical protein
VVDVQTIADKNSRDLIEHIHFAQKNITRPDDELIDFIRKHTGKIRPLAESDLETFVADGKLMLNIGKPFHIEGIGTLQKNKDAVYEFTPGQPVVQRLEAPAPLSPIDHDSDKPVKKKSVFDEDPNELRNASTRRLAIGIGLVIGIGIILWGGYSLLSSKVKTDTGTATASTTTGEQDSQQSSQYLHNLNDPQKALADAGKKDSSDITGMNTADTAKKAAVTPPPAAATTAPVATGPSRMYKYILQTTKFRKTAEDMYAKLKPKVALEAVDSSLFRIVISLPGTPADTARIKDSLHFWYWGPRHDKVVTVE